MSYSELIQRDNPAIVWSLDESSGTTAYPDRFLYSSGSSVSFYTGTYSSSIERSSFPLIYGGKRSIKITGTKSIVLPSLYKMSLKDSRNTSSLEFWVKLNKSSDSEQVFVKKGSASTTVYSTSIYLKNDYITFRLGVPTKYYEVSVPIDTTNKPLHVVATYSQAHISLTVNGINSVKSIKDPDSLFPSLDDNEEFFRFVKPSGIDHIEFDCIALYSYALPREKALKHFVYGVGYSLPADIINSNAGVFYNFSMDGHKEIKKYDMGPGTYWSITSANNCIVKDGVVTIKPKQEPTTYFSKGSLNIKDTEYFTDSGYKFLNNSYLELSNISSIVPMKSEKNIDSWAAKFNGGTYSASKKILFSVYSKKSTNYIKFYTISSGGSNKIYANINGTDTLLATGHTLSNDFYVGYYTDYLSVSNVFFLTSGSQNVVSVSLPEIPSSSIRFGSENVWFDGEDISQNINSFNLTDTNLLKIIGIHEDNSSLYSTFSNIEGSSFKHYYTATPSKEERRFKISSYATASIDIDQQMLCEPDSEITGACRIEIGNPENSKSLLMSLSEKIIKNDINNPDVTNSIYSNDYLNRIITSGSWLNNKTTQTESDNNPTDTLSFSFIFKTDDLSDKPAQLNYFRVSSYAINTESSEKYILNNSSLGGNPAKIYLKNNECNIPDIIEMPFFYNGNKSGLKINNTYAKINHTFSAIQKFTKVTDVTTGSDTVYAVEDDIFSVDEYVTISNLTDFNQTSAVKIKSVASGSITIDETTSGSNLSAQNGIIQIASGVSSIMFMINVPTGTTSNKLIKIGTKQIEVNASTGALSGLSGATSYVNSVSGSTIALDRWQNVFIVFDSPIITPTEIVLGSVDGITDTFYIDQLMIFDKKLTQDNVSNIYNLFTGEITTQVYDSNNIFFTLVDKESATVETSSIVDIDYYITESENSTIYNLLAGGSFDQKTLNITYIQCPPTPTISAITTAASSRNDSFLYMPSSIDGVSASTVIQKIGSSSKSGLSISTLPSPASTTTSSQVTAKSAASGKKATIVIPVASASGIQVGDTVTIANFTYDPKGSVKSANCLTNGSVVTNISGNNITVSVPSPGLVKNISSGKAILFTATSTSTKYILNNAVGGSDVAKNTTVIMSNNKYQTNVTNNNKLKINQTLIKSGDTILIMDESNNYRLYSVSTATDTKIYTINKTISVIFEPVSFIDGNVYKTSISSPSSKTIKYTASPESWVDVEKVQTILRVNSKITSKHIYTE